MKTSAYERGRRCDLHVCNYEGETRLATRACASGVRCFRVTSKGLRRGVRVILARRPEALTAAGWFVESERGTKRSDREFTTRCNASNSTTLVLPTLIATVNRTLNASEHMHATWTLPPPSIQRWHIEKSRAVLPSSRSTYSPQRLEMLVRSKLLGSDNLAATTRCIINLYSTPLCNDRPSA